MGVLYLQNQGIQIDLPLSMRVKDFVYNFFSKNDFIYKKIDELQRKYPKIMFAVTIISVAGALTSMAALSMTIFIIFVTTLSLSMITLVILWKSVSKIQNQPPHAARPLINSSEIAKQGIKSDMLLLIDKLSERLSSTEKQALKDEVCLAIDRTFQNKENSETFSQAITKIVMKYIPLQHC